MRPAGLLCGPSSAPPLPLSGWALRPLIPPWVSCHVGDRVIFKLLRADPILSPASLAWAPVCTLSPYRLSWGCGQASLGNDRAPSISYGSGLDTERTACQCELLWTRQMERRWAGEEQTPSLLKGKRAQTPPPPLPPLPLLPRPPMATPLLATHCSALTRGSLGSSCS